MGEQGTAGSARVAVAGVVDERIKLTSEWGIAGTDALIGAAPAGIVNG